MSTHLTLNDVVMERRMQMTEHKARKSSAAKSWFEVDKNGLAKILERKGKVFAFYELISNAWDTNATEVKVIAVSVGRGKVQLTVEDDDPQGFAFLSHAFTLFAESSKKGDAELRGRFNLGEKVRVQETEKLFVMSAKNK